MRTSALQKAVSIAANLAIVWMELKAIPLSWSGVGMQMFLFYTELSNLFAMGVCLAVALCQIKALVTGGEMPRRVRQFKYTATCCLMLTFLTVVFVLAPMYGPDGHYVMLLTSSMLYNHFLNPVTAFLSFALCERAATAASCWRPTSPGCTRGRTPSCTSMSSRCGCPACGWWSCWAAAP